MVHSCACYYKLHFSVAHTGKENAMSVVIEIHCAICATRILVGSTGLCTHQLNASASAGQVVKLVVTNLSTQLVKRMKENSYIMVTHNQRYTATDVKM